MLAVGSQRLTLTPADVAAARSRARRSRKPHNKVRESFLRELLDVLAGRLAGAIGTDAHRATTGTTCSTSCGTPPTSAAS